MNLAPLGKSVLHPPGREVQPAFVRLESLTYVPPTYRRNREEAASLQSAAKRRHAIAVGVSPQNPDGWNAKVCVRVRLESLTYKKA